MKYFVMVVGEYWTQLVGPFKTERKAWEWGDKSVRADLGYDWYIRTPSSPNEVEELI